VLDLTGVKAQLPPAPALSSLPHLEELRLGWVADALRVAPRNARMCLLSSQVSEPHWLQDEISHLRNVFGS
jgi:hypothetical protein